MPILADVFSYGNTLKRKLNGLLDDPRGTLEQFVGQLGDDVNRNSDLMNQAGWGQIDKVKYTPEQRDAARRKLADIGANMGMAAATVWHGSPHKFSKFDSSKIGTGEGAQAYGHGLYLAESPDVADGYRKALSKNVSVDGAKLQTVPSDGSLAEAHNMTVRNIQNGMSPEDAISATHRYWSDAASEMQAFVKDNPQLADRIQQEVASRLQIADHAKTLKPESFYLDPGSLYKVDLPDEQIAKMLDWDKPLSQQAPEVQKALNGIETNFPEIPDFNLRKWMDADPLASTWHNVIQRDLGVEPDAITRTLKDRGVPGIRYLDGGSRGTGAGTSNFVVFPGNEGFLKILERNGQPMGLLD